MEDVSKLLNSDNSKLEDVSILTINASDLRNKVDTSSSNINKVKHIIAKNVLMGKITTVDKIAHSKYVSTGCPNIDNILEGGIPINGIVELYGASGVGKTQFCLQVVLNIQLPQQLGGMEKGAVYICTEDIFPAKRLNQLADIWKNKYNLINLLDHVYIKHIVEFIQLNKCLSLELPNLMAKKNIGIIIIDSIAGLFRSENVNLNYMARCRDFLYITKALHKLQTQFDCAILVTNQVIDNIATSVQEPCLGLGWSNNINSQYCLIKNQDKARTFSVVFSPNVPPNSTEIAIEREGLVSIN